MILYYSGLAGYTIYVDGDTHDLLTGNLEDGSVFFQLRR
jgi:hypothetical protein